MFPLRWMLVLLSTTMVFYELALGGVPNDRISLILSEITAVNDKVGALAEKTGGIEKKVDSLTEKVADIAHLEEETSGQLKNQVSAETWIIITWIIITQYFLLF